MAVWSKEKSAAWIHEALKVVQGLVGAPVRDGFYSKATHEAIKTGLRAAGSRLVDDVDMVGPQGLLQAFYGPAGVDEKADKAIQTAWAWWVLQREKTPAALGPAQEWIASFNATLVGGGNEPIDAKTAEDFFVGDKSSQWRKLAPWIAGSVVVLGAGIAASVIMSRRRQRGMLVPAYAGRRW